MEINYIALLDWVFLGSYIFLVIMFSYQAYMNLFLTKVSKYSIDALLLFLIMRFGSERARKRAKSFQQDVDRILLFGIYSALSVAGGIWAIIRWIKIFAQD